MTTVPREQAPVPIGGPALARRLGIKWAVALAVLLGLAGCGATSEATWREPTGTATPGPGKDTEEERLRSMLITLDDLPDGYQAKPLDNSGGAAPTGTTPDCSERYAATDRDREKDRGADAGVSFDKQNESVAEAIASYGSETSAAAVFRSVKETWQACPAFTMKVDGDSVGVWAVPQAFPSFGSESYALKITYTLESNPEVHFNGFSVGFRVQNLLVSTEFFMPDTNLKEAELITARAYERIAHPDRTPSPRPRKRTTI